MANSDYLLDDNGDLLITNGDFTVGLSDNQHIQDIIQCFQGEWKQFPLIGAAILTSLNTQRPQDAINRIKTQLQAGKYQIDLLKIDIVDSKLVIQFPNGIKYNG